MKRYLAVPPETLRCNEKNIREHYILNCMGVIITTNHLTDGIYLPAEDRRHYVAWSDAQQDMWSKEDWTNFWNWYDKGGDSHVAAYLRAFDLSDFNSKAPPPKTAAFWSIVNANRTTEEGELADVLDQLSKKPEDWKKGDPIPRPDVVTFEMILGETSPFSQLYSMFKEARNRKAANHKLEECGYRAVDNPAAKDGYWRINDRRQVVYAKVELPLGKQREAAEVLRNTTEKTAEFAAQKEPRRAKPEPAKKPAKF
jgi:hypothetical protein